MAVLISDYAQKSIVSISVLFLVVGFITGPGAFNWISVHSDTTSIAELLRVTLFAVLFTGGMNISFKELLVSYKRPARALLLGLPLTITAIALLAHFLTGFDWIDALLIGAILSPTDPVFATNIIDRTEIPKGVRQLLNIESGLNDGLALPIILIILSVSGAVDVTFLELVREIGMGVLIGLAVPFIAIHMVKIPVFAKASHYRPLEGLAIGLLIFCLARVLNANLYLAAFIGGITVPSIDEKTARDFDAFGEKLAQVLKLLAIFTFSLLVSETVIHAQISWSLVIFTLLTLILVRPAILSLVLLGESLPRRQLLVAGWFGPRGFASILYGLVVLNSMVSERLQLFHLVAIVVTGSIILSSTTDILAVKWLAEQGDNNPEAETSG